MFFNSIEFCIFLPIVFLAYWIIPGKNVRLRNIVLLVSSYFFYGWWDWRFLFLIALSSATDYYVGINLGNTENNVKRKLLLIISIFVNLGLLFFFKYYNFFVQNFVEAFTLFGKNVEVRSLNIILPVGISFYTFQTMSYTIDIYRKKLEPTRDLLSFFTFVSFFPQLVAGPIERATNLLPQFSKIKTFLAENVNIGLKFIVWGLFKKMVIADNCAVYVNDVFGNYAAFNASTIVIATVLFAFQVYGDFSGYSDIAIGTARLFGIKLMRNFALPFFSNDIAMFWRRWHISLTTWVNEYLYTPLVLRFRYWNNSGIIFSVMITFFILGLWHGANWNFIIFGLLHGIGISAELLTRKSRKKVRNKLPFWLTNVTGILLTFGYFCFTIIFFRATSIGHAIGFLIQMFSGSWLSDFRDVHILPVLIIFLLVVEWITRNYESAMVIPKFTYPTWLRYAYYSFIISLIGVFGYMEQIPFVYFQF